uniref:Uncharacterized protein n=1 Tax=Corethron hystrix TaxID=216773 RepID=A0A7S1FSS2_9STRA|mmetsp:Transcript_24741/g.56927  ORF Transcript_24741/g.56927 Transcript_24741/m.56927 type:complete len:320 (+) Transcript_24741:315-1274(+)
MTSRVLHAPYFLRSCAGWGLTRCPETIRRELVEALHNGLVDGPREEVNVHVIEKFGDAATPLFVHNYRLNRKVLSTLRTMHEEWAGVPLVEEISYGLRVYRNNSNLLMHVDKPVTHVISSILHIDHSEDSEPWPIVIEDFQGNTNEVVLESGDMLFYESSKCLHGRPKTFKGSWYSSIFTHYSPVGWDKASKETDSHYAVPSVWNKMVPNVHNVDALAVVGMSIKEPECENLWCALRDSVKWSGPSEMGSVLTTGGKRTPIQVPEVLPGWDYVLSPHYNAVYRDTVDQVVVESPLLNLMNLWRNGLDDTYSNDIYSEEL